MCQKRAAGAVKVASEKFSGKRLLSPQSIQEGLPALLIDFDARALYVSHPLPNPFNTTTEMSCFALFF